MHTDIDGLSRNLYCLRSELLGPIITMNGAYKLWIRDAPETANKTVQQIGALSEQLLSEIHHLPNTFDLQSTDIAAKQLHSWQANRKRTWKNYHIL